MWTLDAVADALAPLSAAATPAAGFACEDTLALASETIGFAAPGGRAGGGEPPGGGHGP
jgi:hypothetical protein